MIVQKILLPNKHVCPQKSLYIREISGTTYDINHQKLDFVLHSRCKFDTYFNAFSLTKWKRFCEFTSYGIHIVAEGNFIIQIFQTVWKNGVSQKLLFSQYFENEVYIRLNPEETFGVISFILECTSEEGHFISGDYFIDDEPLRDAKICMAVCTYRREEYILGNLKQIQKAILNNPESPLKDKLDIIVSDNGNTLPLNKFKKHIKIVYNKNLGGAGGFTRDLVEILDIQDQKQYTHVLLTDDDIKLEPAVLERTYAMLRYLKPTLRESFIGGSMFRTDNMAVQNEMANRWEKGKVIPLRHNIKMDSFANVVSNENPEKINYFSWWYCCMPIGVINRSNLPLPLFIKRDDIEYGLRNGSSFITINGINVWHEPFEGKRPAYLEYYYIRNQLIMESSMEKNMSIKALLNITKKRLLDDVAKFHYLEFKFFCMGILDYCKGIDFFKSIDAVQLNSDLRALDRKFVPLEELPIPFDEKKYRASFPYRERRRHLIFRRLTLNGWLLPAKKEPAIVQSAFPRKLPFYRVKSALNVEYISKTGYISYKSWKSLRECYKLYKQTVNAIKKYYGDARSEFVSRWRELITYDFWKQYLFEDPTPTDKLTPVKVDYKPGERIEKNTFYVNCLDTLSVNPKRIYLESRKGTDFASNIFAVAKELNKEKYKDFEVYLSYTPEAKDLIVSKIEKNGLKKIKLVEKDGHDFLKVMATAKYFFTDFHLFPHFVKREGQVVVSLWHGTPLKTLGKDCKSETQASVQRIFYLADYQVYPGQFMEDKMIDVYWLANLYNGKILETGYPRNAMFFDEERRKQIRSELNLDGKQVIMYMPTFRGSAGNNQNDLQSARIAAYFDELDGKLNDDQIFYIKLHNYNTSSIDCSKYKHIQEAPSQYDNYELQNACDLLVTDYSSVFFDFAVSRRKIILFQYDQEDYLNNRGVCLPLDELPFPIVKDVDGLVDEINKPIKYNDKEFLKKYATFDNKDATALLCSRVILDEKLPAKFKEKKLKHNGKKNIFIYTGTLRTRQSSLSFWDHVNALDFDKANYFLLYYDPVMWKNAFRLLPMDDKCNQIGLWSYTSYTKEEKILHDDYIAKRDLTDRVKVPLAKMYKRELVKHFGNGVKADAVILWNSTDPNLFNLFSTFTKRKYVVYPDGFQIFDAALIDASSSYKRLNYSEFNEKMENASFLRSNKK